MPAAHAVSDASYGAGAGRLATVEKRQQRARIIDYHRIAQLARGGENEFLILLTEPVQADRPAILVAKFVPDLSLPVIEIRDQAVVADSRDPARDVEQLLAQPPYIHEHDHRWERSLLLRVDNERIHAPARSRDVVQAFFHEQPAPSREKFAGSENTSRRRR